MAQKAANRRLRLVEVDFIIMHGAGELKRNRITVHASVHHGGLHLSFSLGGPAESRETLPAALVETLRAGLEYARKHVRLQDLVEEDLALEVDEGQQ